jgi:hypothetical protein
MPDRLTLIAISALAYVLSVALHEHAGHAAACVLLGSHPLELGAFYVSCDDTLLGSMNVRLVALAGPLVSLFTGIACFLLLRGKRPEGRASWYFTWLLGSLGLMSAAGYPLFSGVAGIGDLGTGADAVFFGVSPEWVVRVTLTIVGAASYMGVVFLAARMIGPHVPGAGAARLRSARMIALTSYLTGGVVYLAIGVLNPYGFVIVATSALASSMGGTSGLLWMMRVLKWDRDVAAPGVVFARSWGWIGAAAVLTLAYAIVLGPTLKP